METDSHDEEFHSRTRRLIDEVAVSSSTDSSIIDEKWSKFSVYLSIDPAWVDTHAGQLMLLSTLNMVARFCNRVFLQASLSTVERIVGFPFCSQSNLIDSCQEITWLVNPHVSVHATDVQPTESVALSVGGKSDISISSDGWFAYLNWNSSRIEPANDFNPFGALIASSFGSAEVFRKLIGQIGAKGAIAQRTLEDIRFSVLDYSCNSPMPFNPPFPDSVNIGRVLFAGCGAVSNGAMTALYEISNLAGTFGLVDDESVSHSNVGRYLMTSLQDVGNPKASVLQERFRGKSVSIEPFNLPIETLPTESIDGYDIVFSGLDNRNNNQARFVLQNSLPYRIIHAATQGLAVSIANIRFNDGICLGCLFSPRPGTVSLVPDSVCGGVVLKTEQQEIAASVSFISAASGILAASELVKVSVPELRAFALDNYLSLSMMSPDLADAHHRRKDEYCLCLCSEEIRLEAYRDKHVNKKEKN